MKVNAITFGEDRLPNGVNVNLSMAEVAWIAGRAGDEWPSTEVSSEIYTILTEDVIHPYFDDGIAELKREEGVSWTPVQRPTPSG